MGAPRHVWREVDDRACIGAWDQHGGRVPRNVIAELADLIGATEASVRMRIGNVDSILGTGRLANAAKLTHRTCAAFAEMDIQERRKDYEEALTELRAARAERLA